jgi:hypothetical protein
MLDFKLEYSDAEVNKQIAYLRNILYNEEGFKRSWKIQQELYDFYHEKAFRQLQDEDWR